MDHMRSCNHRWYRHLHKTMITCDEDLAGQIYFGREELKVRSIGHCAMLEDDAMHLGQKQTCLHSYWT